MGPEMTLARRIIGLAAGAALLAAPALAGSTAAAASTPAAGSASEAAPLPAFDFARHTNSRFLADQSAAIQKLSSAQTREQLQDARMDVAELYLAHLMLPEGQSVLDAVVPEYLNGAEKRRWGALSAAFRLMDGKPLAKDAQESPLVAANKAWPDYDFWMAMQAIRARDGAGITAHLQAAYKRLGTYPKVYAETCLPIFLNAALDTQQWDLAKSIAEGFDAYPDLKAQAVYPYLLGRAAQLVKRPERAYQAYSNAADLSGPYARKAVLALVDLGLADRSVTPEKAQKLLQGNLARWRGGEIELETLRRLARVDREIGDWPGLLMTLGRITRDFPHSPDAEPAQRQADSLLAGYYPFAMSGKLPLAQLLDTHRRITPYYRLDDTFEAQSEALADHLLKLGATALAAQEYARIGATLELVQAKKVWQVAPGRIARVRIGEAAALAAGGQYKEAAAVLAQVGMPDKPDEDRFNSLKAEVYMALGDAGKVAGTKVDDPDAAYIRTLAQAQFDKGEWSGATAAYGRLWKRHPRDFAGADAINLMLAAYRAGDRMTAEKVAEAFPELGNSPEWSAFAAGLLKTPAGISPLKLQAADARLESAGQVIDRVGKAGAALGPSKAKN